MLVALGLVDGYLVATQQSSGGNHGTLWLLAGVALFALSLRR